MQLVRESLDEGYCDVSGRVSDLVYIGKGWIHCSIYFLYHYEQRTE